ncbi:MAG: hypothetical protein HW413_978 [Thermoleophilia bacterium]|nr:hypothetical protein [Thermoleophilia bacterium]
MSTRKVRLFIDPFTHHHEGDRLFDLSAGAGGGDDVLEPFVHLRSELERRGIECHTADLLERTPVDGGVNLYVSLGQQHRFTRLERRGDVVLSAFFALEAPIVEPSLFRGLPRVAATFNRVFSYSSTDALREFTGTAVPVLPVRLPQAYGEVHRELWERGGRRLLVMISANKLPRLYVRELYTERLRAIEFFDRFHEIDLYGVGWEGPPFRVGTTWAPGSLRRLSRRARLRWHRFRPPSDPVWKAVRHAYRGPVDSKAQTMSGYTFAICFENMVLEGWITEKIFDCLFCGTVPVYLGAPDIERWVPPECFIDMRRFASYEELREYLRGLSPMEIAAFREAGREYVRSDRYRPFTKQAFADLMLRIVEEDAGVVL